MGNSSIKYIQQGQQKEERSAYEYHYQTRTMRGKRQELSPSQSMHANTMKENMNSNYTITTKKKYTD